ncbi:hypothetical protein HK096_002434 [Nowakowskiella sp. JEL0078]|nr:hypothetical protein HK096_002434 [Nowakowskiella sp. JEL0078]
MLIPAVLYLVQNNLQYVSLTLLDAATVQVTYQMKIITTAIFSVILLNRKLSVIKWFSLVLLTFGIAMVQLPSNSSTSDVNPGNVEKLIGLSAIIVASILSGVAGVYFEMVLKGTSASLWIRNIQLSLFGLIPGLVGGK